MISESLRTKIIKIVNDTLDISEEQWNNTLEKSKLIKRAVLNEAAQKTNIPGHPYLKEGKYKSDTFVALMLDMRDSKKHLRQAISARVSKVSQMQRVYYEVSALLPAMAYIIEEHKGAVTEYLGDGLLALFLLPKENITERENVLRNVMTCSKKCLDASMNIVSNILTERYGLPSIKIGIGLAFSDAIISHFGLPPNTQVKVIGECVYFASQLSKGNNEIIIHENLEYIWPTSKTGKLRFSKRVFEKFNGYVVLENKE